MSVSMSWSISCVAPLSSVRSAALIVGVAAGVEGGAYAVQRQSAFTARRKSMLGSFCL